MQTCCVEQVVNLWQKTVPSNTASTGSGTTWRINVARYICLSPCDQIIEVPFSKYLLYEGKRISCVFWKMKYDLPTNWLIIDTWNSLSESSPLIEGSDNTWLLSFLSELIPDPNYISSRFIVLSYQQNIKLKAGHIINNNASKIFAELWKRV